MTAVRTICAVAVDPSAWTALADVDRVAAALPGCTGARPGIDGRLHLDVDVAVASVRGRWTGTATPIDADAVHIVGAGDVGTLDVVARASADHTSVTVEGTADGPLAAIGAGLLAAAVRRTTTAFLTALADPPAPPAAAPNPVFSRLDRLPEQPDQARKPGGRGWIGAIAGMIGLVIGIAVGRRGRAR